jgi:Domain of unknown function (DUF5667)
MTRIGSGLRAKLSRSRSPKERFAQLLDADTASAADAELGSMLAIAGALRVAGGATETATDPDFRAALRQRLVAVATVQAFDADIGAAPGQVRRARVRTRRRLTAAVAAVAVVTSIAGVSVATSRSLPGDPFFGVKRATENVQLWATHGDAAKGHRHLEFAQTRLAESTHLAPTSSHLVANLAAMDSQTQQGATELIAAYKSSKSRSPAPLTEILTFAREQYAGLAKLAATVPAAVKAEEQRAVTLLQNIVAQVQKLSAG